MDRPLLPVRGLMTELVDTWLHHQGRPVHGRTSRSGQHPDRPTLVLVHGLVVSGRYLLPLAEALAGSFDVHVPDLPGFGRSPGPTPPLGIVDLADAVIGWMDAAQLSDAVLVSNSFGCQIVLEAAIRYPDRVTALVLQGPSTDARARSTRAQLKRFTKNAMRESPSLYPLVLMDYLKTAKGHLLSKFRAAVSDPIEEKLRDVAACTLIISGERDPISPPDWCRRMALEMPDAEHAEIEGGSHTMVYSEPRLVARLIQHFVLGRRLSTVAPAKVLLGDPEAPEFIADIDSSTAMLRATSRGLHEESFENLGLSRAGAKLKSFYAAAGLEGISPRHLDRVNSDSFRKWVVDGYPACTHPAIFIGSSNGAIAHLATAMKAPWLPQSFLVPVRKSVIRSPDLVREMERGRELASPLLATNTDVSVVHVHDPNRNLFRIRLLELGTVYRTFIHRYLDPGGTIYVVDCQKKAPQVRLNERHAFQPGEGGGRRAPDADHSGPDGEYGFEPSILADILELAKKRDYRVVRVSFEEPDDLSPLVAEAMSDWYRDMGFRDRHLLVGNFVLMDPWWAIRTGSVPFWTAHNSSESVARVRDYLARSDRWRSVDLMLYSRGKDAPVDVDRWQDVIRVAGTGALLGIEAHEYPRDFGIIGRYSRALREQVARRDWPLRPLEVARLDRHLFERPENFHASELTVSSRDVRTHVTLRPATPALISLPNW